MLLLLQTTNVWERPRGVFIFRQALQVLGVKQAGLGSVQFLTFRRCSSPATTEYDVVQALYESEDEIREKVVKRSSCAFLTRVCFVKWRHTPLSRSYVFRNLTIQKQTKRTQFFAGPIGRLPRPASFWEITPVFSGEKCEHIVAFVTAALMF